MKLNVTWPPAGRYILAVSGGADSIALLDLFARTANDRGYELIVAHFDHGLRPDSAADGELVRAAAARYGLPFEATHAGLGQASEAAARAARYGWLEQVRQNHRAAAIITGHHQDDLIETSLLNLARGSGRLGLAPMQSGPILRPLLALTRAELREHAAGHHLSWREDPTNTDTTNPRNFLRLHLLSEAAPAWRRQYLTLIGRLNRLNKSINQDLDDLLNGHQDGPSAYLIPHDLVRDLSLPELEELLLAAARRLCPDVEPGRRTVQEIALFAKTARPYRQRPLRKGLNVIVQTKGVRVYYTGISESRLEDET